MNDSSAAIAAIFTILFSLIGVAMCVLMIIAQWKMFVKAGQPGWKSIIPIYGFIVRWSLSWEMKFFWLSFIPFTAPIFYIMFLVKEAQAYGKSGGYIAGYILLNPVFYILLGFSKNTQYVRGMNQGYIANGAYYPDNNGYNYNYNNNNYQG